MPPPYSVVQHEVTDSTQDDARAAFDGTPVLVVAAGQRRGRGRSANEWQNAPRAMAASLAVRPDWDSSRLPLVPLLAGVAAARVIDCRLKWPNDVFMGEVKVGGILVEGGDGPVVVGFGVNLWWPDAPDGYGAVYPDDPGSGRDIEIAESWAGELLDLLASGPTAWPRDEYRQRCITLGRDITWSPDGAGRAIDIAPDGALIVVTPQGRTTLHAGEVRHVRGEP